MTQIQFYHLLSTPLEAALPKLMEKALGAGLEGVIISDTESTLARLDDALWAAEPSSFIPHSLISQPNSDSAPIRLSLTEPNQNLPPMLVVTDGSQPADASAYDRLLDIFNGHDPAAVQNARTRWKTYKEAGHSLSYIQQQEDGSWQKRA